MGVAVLKDVPRDKLDVFVAACRKTAAHGLVTCSSGNLSARLDEQRMLISGSRAWLAEITPDAVSVVRLADAEPLAGPRPSVESRFHAGILRERGDVNVVLHFQSPFATAVACGSARPDFNVIIEVPYYIGPVAWVGYLPPGSAELAAAVTSAMREHDLAIMRNHGEVTVGRGYDDAIQRAAFFELACGIVVRAGAGVEPIAPDAAAKLRPPAAGSAGGV
jgi:ribulose-5-phosphate 4-epimerase/fuculose-1-phosphate aldolase